MAIQPDYRGVRLKLRRARSHITALNREIRKLPQPNTLLHVDKNGYATAAYDGKLPPLRLGVYVGDFAHNARSALDNLVWQLVMAHGAIPGKHNVFPVYAEEGNWLQDVEQRDPARGHGPLDGVSADALRKIRDVQPFSVTTRRKDAVRTALFQLHRLSLIDKHRFVHAVHVNTAEDVRAVFEVPPPGIKIVGRWHVQPGQPLRPGQKILRLRLLDYEDKPVTSDYVSNFQIFFDFAFDLGPDGGGVIRVKRLKDIFADTADIIENLISAVGQVNRLTGNAPGP